MRSTLHEPVVTAEHRLWRAVLEQAYVDAEGGPEAGEVRTAEDSDDDSGGGSHERLRARCYLRGDSKPDAAALTLVCGFAEIPADRVLNWARRSYPRPQAQLRTPQHTQLSSRTLSQDLRAILPLKGGSRRGRPCELASA